MAGDVGRVIKGETVKIRIFGRAGCARTHAALFRIARLVRQKTWTGKVEIVFFDLGTAEGLAEAAYRQLEGEIPAVLVETERPGPVISGEPPSRERASTREASILRVLTPSPN